MADPKSNIKSSSDIPHGSPAIAKQVPMESQSVKVGVPIPRSGGGDMTKSLFLCTLSPDGF